MAKLNLFVRFGIGKFDRMESVAFFGQLEVFDDGLMFEMLKEGKQEFAGATFNFRVSIFEATFFKNVVEGDDRTHLFVSKNFLNANHGVIFEFDIHGGVLLSGHVKQVSVISENLAFGLSHGEKRTRSVEKNDSVSIFAIDGGIFGIPSRK